MDRLVYEVDGGIYIDDDFHYFSCETKSFYMREFLLPDDAVNITGPLLLDFQKRHDCGNDFYIFTNPHLVEDFLKITYNF